MRPECFVTIVEIGEDGSMWTEKRRMIKYRVVVNPANDRYRVVERKKWWSLIWYRCRGLEHDYFDTVEAAKKAIPLYDKGAAYWVGTMVDLTAERLGVKTDG